MKTDNKVNATEILEYIANIISDGHFTIMKFTTNWRVSFYTPHSYENIEAMAEGKTLQEAIIKAIQAENGNAKKTK